MATSGTGKSPLRTASRIDAGVAPAARAATDASWMVAPSMTGSENGRPTSTASAPASTMAASTSTQSARTPPVT